MHGRMGILGHGRRMGVDQSVIEWTAFFGQDGTFSPIIRGHSGLMLPVLGLCESGWRQRQSRWARGQECEQKGLPAGNLA